MYFTSRAWFQTAPIQNAVGWTARDAVLSRQLLLHLTPPAPEAQSYPSDKAALSLRPPAFGRLVENNTAHFPKLPHDPRKPWPRSALQQNTNNTMTESENVSVCEQRGSGCESVPKSNTYQNYPVLFSEHWIYGRGKIKIRDSRLSDPGFAPPQVEMHWTELLPPSPQRWRTPQHPEHLQFNGKSRNARLSSSSAINQRGRSQELRSPQRGRAVTNRSRGAVETGTVHHETFLAAPSFN